jgi:hypothetical protein
MVRLADRDPDEVVDVAEACTLLGVSRPTLYRNSSLQRVRRSPGRVGYRIGDILELVRAAGDSDVAKIVTDGAFESGNCLIRPRGGVWELDVMQLQSESGGALWRVAVCSDDLSAPVKSVTLQLPSASAATRMGCKEIRIWDIDGGAGEEPILVLPDGDDRIDGQTRYLIGRSFGKALFVPWVFHDTRMGDRWSVD